MSTQSSWFWAECLFYCKPKPAYEMRISDWSSDVCSSDLRCLRQRRGFGPHRNQPITGNAFFDARVLQQLLQAGEDVQDRANRIGPCAHWVEHILIDDRVQALQALQIERFLAVEMAVQRAFGQLRRLGALTNRHDP